MSKSKRGVSKYVDATRLISLIAGFSMLWLILTDARISSWVIGVLVVPLATWLSIKLASNSAFSVSGTQPASNTVFRLCWLRIPSFLLFFFSQSIKGGWETAIAALSPMVRCDPDFFTYRTQLPEGSPQLYFVHLISLLPGTVSVDMKKSEVRIHELDKRAHNPAAISAAEKEVAKLFGLALGVK